MSDLIERQAAIDKFREVLGEGYVATLPSIEARLNELPTADVVSREVVNQIKWERDTAVQQLEELGYGFGERREE